MERGCHGAASCALIQISLSLSLGRSTNSLRAGIRARLI
jgi:hypothetical protein